MAALTTAAVQGTVATGPRAGAPLLRRLGRPPRAHRAGPLCAAQNGLSLHAATCVPATDQHRLELLCRYVLRPPLSAARLRWLDSSTLAFSLKAPWSDGTCELLVSPHEFLEKLAALVAPPRGHLIRYHGVLAPHAAHRRHLVPHPAPPGTSQTTHPTARPCRHAWQQLLARVFQIQLTCPRCGGPLRVLAALTDPRSIRTYLTGIGLDSKPPPIAPAHLPTQTDLDFAA
jgi:hypothetical protein